MRGYSDADWRGDSDESKSTSRYVFTLSGGAISWYSKKYDNIALSTIKAEEITYSIATQEAIWLRSFLQDLNLTPKVDDPIELLFDNTPAIPFAKDLKFH